MTGLIASALDPAIDVTSAAGGALELEDRRTGFRVVIDELEDQEELELVLAEIGMLAGTGADEARQRQHVFQQHQAWSERLTRLNELLAFAVENVPFYRARSHVYARALEHPDALRGLPILRRIDLKSSMLELCSDRLDFKQEVASGRLEMVSTSGTTDERVQAFADSTHTRIPGQYPELWGVTARNDAPRTAVLTSPLCMADKCTLEASFESRIVHEHTLFLPGLTDLFAIGREDVEKVADELGRFSPALWLVNPVYAHWLGRQARVFGVALPVPDVIVSTYQYLSEAQRRGLHEYFGVPVFNLYSATELGGCQIGLECGRGRLHAREDQCLVELLDRDGLPVQRGLGSVVVTTLANEVMPLVRYATGDLAEPIPAACDCLLQEWPAFELHGREREAVYLDGAFITTRQVDAIVGKLDGIDFYTCKQVAKDELELEVIPALDRTFNSSDVLTALSASLPSVRVRVTVVSRLEPAPSLKYPLTLGHSDTPGWLRV
jgi:phenylacetate-coenzyme A ligase PaaK-like adenylate-forming protein